MQRGRLLSPSWDARELQAQMVSHRPCMRWSVISDTPEFVANLTSSHHPLTQKKNKEKKEGRTGGQSEAEQDPERDSMGQRSGSISWTADEASKKPSTQCPSSMPAPLTMPRSQRTLPPVNVPLQSVRSASGSTHARQEAQVAAGSLKLGSGHSPPATGADKGIGRILPATDADT